MKLCVRSSIAIVALAVLCLTLLSTNSLVTEDSSQGPIQPPARRVDLSAFGQIALLSPEDDVANIDVARLNLLCADGLPGAENLNIEQRLTELDRWAEHVKTETDRHLYRFLERPSEYENSEAYFRVLMMIVALQGDLDVHYNQLRINNPEFHVLNRVRDQ